MDKKDIAAKLEEIFGHRAYDHGYMLPLPSGEKKEVQRFSVTPLNVKACQAVEAVMNEIAPHRAVAGCDDENSGIPPRSPQPVNAVYITPRTSETWEQLLNAMERRKDDLRNAAATPINALDMAMLEVQVEDILAPRPTLPHGKERF